MSKRNWCIFAGVVGLALLGSIAFGLGSQVGYSNRAHDGAAYYAKHAADEAQQACLSSGDGAVKKANCLHKAAYAHRIAARDKQRDYDDLVAQQKSALWTMIMGIAALIGMALSVVGVALVWTTFQETKKANDITLGASIRANGVSIWKRGETGHPKTLPTVGGGADLEGQLFVHIVGNGYAAINEGKVRALILPTANIPPRAQHPLIESAVVAFADPVLSTENPAQPMHFEIKIDPAEWKRTSHLFVIGEVKYSTAFRTRCHLGFARRYDRHKRRFVATDDPDYEFDI